MLLAMGFVHPVHEGMIKTLGLELDPRGNVKADTDRLPDLARRRCSPPATCGAASRWWCGRSARAARRPRDRQVPDGIDDPAAVSDAQFYQRNSAEERKRRPRRVAASACRCGGRPAAARTAARPVRRARPRLATRGRARRRRRAARWCGRRAATGSRHRRWSATARIGRRRRRRRGAARRNRRRGRPAPRSPRP